MFDRLVPRPIRRLWNEASVWRWCLILAVVSTGMLLIAAPPPSVATAATKVATQPPAKPGAAAR
jgi:anti-sigma-K factor RskA